MLLTYVGIELIAIALCLVTIVILMQIEITQGQKCMSCFILCVLVQNAAYLLEMVSTVPEAALVAIRMQYLGSCWTMLFFYRFVYYYCGFQGGFKLRNVMAFLDLVILCLNWTCRMHPYFYKSMTFVYEGEYPHFVMEYGIGYYGFIIVCCILPVIFSHVIMFSTVHRNKASSLSKHYKYFAIVSCIPLLVLALYSVKAFGNTCFDPNPAMMGILLSLTVIFIWRGNNYDISRSASIEVLEGIDNAVILLDANENINGFNKVATQVFSGLSDIKGFPVSELTELPYEEIKNGVDNISIADSSYSCHLKRISDYNDVTRGYIIFLDDVTSTKKFIEELNITKAAAESANNAKSLFIANMSHEIRTPMNAIVGLSELIKEESIGRKVYDYACDIETSSKHLLDMLSSIIDMSAIESGTMELANDYYSLEALIESTNSVMSLIAVQRGLDFRVTYDDSLPYKLFGDSGRIKQILSDLIGNAFKFTSSGYVNVNVRGQAEGLNTLNLVFEIEDTGVGIAPEECAKIFDEFHQVDAKNNRNAEGTGVGLAVAQKIANLMGGKITVVSTLGVGSTFTLYVPQKIVDSKSIAQMPLKETVKKPKSKMFTVPDCRVLVVDDNLINRKVALGALKQYGFILDDVDSGQKAIDFCDKNNYDIVFMDHMMPEMDGITATKIIREHYGSQRRLPVIVALTANTVNGAEDMFKANGMHDFLAKPIDRAMLHRILDKFISDEKKIYVEDDKSSAAINNDNQSVSLYDFSDIILEDIDVKKILEYHTGTLDDYLEILYLFYMSGDDKYKLMKRQIEEKDWNGYRIEVHALKSSAANLGATKLSEKAKAQEFAAAELNEEFILQNNEDMFADYTKILGEIKKLLERKNYFKAHEQQNGTADIKHDELIAGFEEALDLLENFKSKECQAKVDELLAYKLDEKAFDYLNKTKMKLKMYADDDAEDILREAIEVLRGE